MTPVERWMLPDGIEEILPPEAREVERLRRHLLDLFSRWGYELVMPPMMEFTDSLLVGLGKDIDLLTFKVTDQLSGRSMGIRADMTPQIARIDAHSLKRSGVNRLCYAGHVLQTKMQNALSTRTPMQVGIELFGEPGLDADAEVVSLLLDTLAHANVDKVCLDLGHVGIYRALAEEANISTDDEMVFFSLLQAKALTEIAAWVKAHFGDGEIGQWLLALPRLAGARSVIDTSRATFAGAPDEVFVALDELEAVADILLVRYPDAQLYFDLSELTGYHYLTGLGFAVFAEGQGAAIARGGRYDHIGEVFGRSRSATGFTADLVALHRLSQRGQEKECGIFVVSSDSPELWQKVQALRSAGERVVLGLAQQTEPLNYQNCDRILLQQGETFEIQPL